MLLLDCGLVGLSSKNLWGIISEEHQGFDRARKPSKISLEDRIKRMKERASSMQDPLLYSLCALRGCVCPDAAGSG